MLCDVKKRIADCMKQGAGELNFQCGDVSLGPSKDKCLVSFLGDGEEGQVWIVKNNNFATTSSSTSTALVVYDDDAATSKTSGSTSASAGSSSAVDARQSFWEEQEKALPGVIMATGDRVFHMLYQLATLNDHNTVKVIKRLFHLIPTDPSVNEALDGISSHTMMSSPLASADISPKLSPRKAVMKQTSEAAREQLAKLFDATSDNMSPFRVLYNLEVLSGRLMPTRQQEPSHQFSHDFLKVFIRKNTFSILSFTIFFNFQAGGLRLMLNVFEKDSLPIDLDYDIRQAIYVVALQIAGYLLCGQTVIQKNIPVSSVPTSSTASTSGGGTASSVASNQVITSPMMKPTPPKKSALDATANQGKSPIALSASKIVQTMTEVEFNDTVSCLTRVVWAAAVGNLQLASSNMGGGLGGSGSESTNMRFLASRRSRDSSTGSSTGSTTGSDSGGLVMTGSASANTSGSSDSGLQSGTSSAASTGVSGMAAASRKTVVNKNDAHIAGEAFDLLVTCLQLRSKDIAFFYNLPYVADFIIETVLGSPSNDVRVAACDQLIRMSKIRITNVARALNLDGPPPPTSSSTTTTGSESEAPMSTSPTRSPATSPVPRNTNPKQFLTKILLKTPVPLWMPSCKARGATHTLLGQCSEYFNLRCHLLKNFTRKEQDVLGENARIMIEDELTFLHNYGPCHRPEDCTLLAGHLKLVETLLAADGVNKVDVGNDLIGEILDSYLFPASKMISDGALNGSSDHDFLDLVQARNVNPKCDTPESRVAAYHLLTSLAKGCPENMSRIVETLVKMHHNYSEALCKEFEHEPAVDRRAACNFVGLKNAGATCYMNSVLQQLYTVPGVGEAVLSSLDYEENDEAAVNEETILYQLQNVFGHLLSSKLQHYVPEKFWKTFRLWGQPVNVREQQDAFEFFTQIVDQIDEMLTEKKKPKIFSRYFEGIFSDQKICQGCPHRFEREQSFMALNLTVKSNNLQESLDQFVRGELLEGDNAYFCEKCQEKRNAIKRMCIRTLPHTLVIQLKRFHYDWETNRAVKFDDYFQFPWTLEMGPYTADGIRKAEKEMKASTSTTSEDSGTGSDQQQQKAKKKVSLVTSPTKTSESTSSSGDNRKLSFSTFSKAVVDENKEQLSHPYDLVGVVVHSGQANAGHYYSFIKERTRSGGSKWYKFNDTTVEEFEMNDETLAQECFGGNYKVKKTSLASSLPENRQRYWNAYMLFYESRKSSQMRKNTSKKSTTQSVSLAAANASQISLRKTSSPAIPAAAPRESWSQLSNLLEKGEKTGLFKQVSSGRMPAHIERGIQEDNLRFMQNRDVFCEDYYRFVCDLISVNDHHSTGSSPVLATESAKLAVNFLLNSYCHVKRRQRAVICDIVDTIEAYLDRNQDACEWMLTFLSSTDGLRYLRSYLLECPAKEVRLNFSQLVERTLRHFHRHFATTETDHVNRLMSTLVSLINDDVANHIKVCGQFFGLVAKFAKMGVRQCHQLLQLDIFRAMIKLLIGVDPETEAEATTVENRQRRWTLSQARELGEFHATLSCLILACDTSGLRSVVDPEGDDGKLSRRTFNPTEQLVPVPEVVGGVLTGKLAPLFIREAVCACREVTASAVPLIIEMLVHSAYCCATFSQLLIEELMKQYNNVNSGELKNLSTLLIEVLVSKQTWF